MSLRRARAVIGALVFGVLLVLATLVGGPLAARLAAPRRARAAALGRALGATDLALFTEARYTRNPAQADLLSPFLDHPGALEHFPSGSLFAPPRPEAPR